MRKGWKTLTERYCFFCNKVTMLVELRREYEHTVCDDCKREAVKNKEFMERVIKMAEQGEINYWCSPYGDTSGSARYHAYFYVGWGWAIERLAGFHKDGKLIFDISSHSAEGITLLAIHSRVGKNQVCDQVTLRVLDEQVNQLRKLARKQISERMEREKKEDEEESRRIKEGVLKEAFDLVGLDSIEKKETQKKKEETEEEKKRKRKHRKKLRLAMNKQNSRFLYPGVSKK